MVRYQFAHKKYIPKSIKNMFINYDEKNYLYDSLNLPKYK